MMLTLLSSFSTFAEGRKYYQSQCVLNFKNPHRFLIKACKKIKTENALACVRHFSSMHSFHVEACGSINNRYELACVQSYDDASVFDIEDCSKMF